MIVTRPLTLLLAPLVGVGMPGAPSAAAAAATPHVPARMPATPPAAKESGRAAVREPEPGAYLGAIQVYPFEEGALYRLVTAPGRVSAIALEPGETLIAVAAGDTARWNVGDTTSGAGETQRTHVMIKPQAAGLRTNLVITTDRRVYHLALESREAAAMVAIRWRYPNASPLVLERAAERTEAAATSFDPAALDFAYTIDGDDPPWRPLRAFDDGRQVYIEFPADLGKWTAPPLFVVGPEGKPRLVNYRVRGHHYIVDRLFAVAELRHGEEAQTVVRICRSSAPAQACRERDR